LLTFSIKAQVVATNSLTVEWYIQNVLAGTGVVISNVQFNAGPGNIQNDQVGEFTDATSSIGLPAGLLLGSGDVTMASQPNLGGGSTLGGGTGPGVDVDLASITPNQINDECIVEFDFVPSGDSIIFSYVFASEEYEEYVCGSVNDAFGFFLTGTNPSGPNYVSSNLALVPDPLNPSTFTTTPVSINTVNPGVAGSAGNATNCAGIDPNWASYNVFYAGANPGTDYEYDGRTVQLFCKAAVNCGETYHIKLAIGDGGDGAFDSGVFLESGSFSSPQPIVSILPVDENGDIIEDGALPEGCIDASLLLIKPYGYTDSTYVMNLTIGGTAINGTDYTNINTSYTIPIGVDTLEVVIDAFLDGIAEGTETLIIGTFFVLTCGDTIDIVDTLHIIDVAPDYNLILQDTILQCPRDSLMVVVSSDGGIPNIDYDWYTMGVINDTVWLPATTVGTTYYPVIATDFCGIISIDSIAITLMSSTPPSIFFQDDFLSTCVGQNGILLDAIAVTNIYDPDSLTYDWNPGSSDSSSIIVFPIASDNWYYLTVYDGCNTVTDSVNVMVDAAELDSVVSVQATGCIGQNATLGSITVYPADPGWNYTLIGNGNTVGPQTSNVFNNLEGNITYALVAMDPNGCIADTGIFVGLTTTAINATFVQNSLSDISCFGAADGAAEVQNISGGVNMPTPGPFTVLWSHFAGPTITNGGISLGGGDAVNTLIGGNWEVVVTEQGSGCAWSHLFMINEPQPISVTENSNEPDCFGNSTGSLTAFGAGGTQPYSFEIFDESDVMRNIPGSNTANSLQTGWYTYEVTDANGCSAIDSSFLDQPGPLEINFSTEDILCYGRNTGVIEIDTVINYTSPYNEIAYYWDPDASGVSNPIGHKMVNQLAAGEYVIEVYSGNCHNSFTIFIEDAIPIVLDLGQELAYCRTQEFQKGNGVVYGSATGGAGNFVFEWENLDTDQTTTTTTWAGLNPGVYQFTAVDQNNCIASELTVLDSVSPIAAFTPISDGFHGPGEFEGTEYLDVTFVNESMYFANPNNPLADTTFKWSIYANDPEGAEWFFSHNINEKIKTSYEGEVEYLVCLVASNFNGCTDTFCEVVIVHEPPVLGVPNVFTPGSAPNNEFYFPSVALEEFEATVFNRYGIEVFKFTSMNDKWDGNNSKNGKPCEDGVYFYSYKAVSTNGTLFEGQGHVNLFRSKD